MVAAKGNNYLLRRISELLPQFLDFDRNLLRFGDFLAQIFTLGFLPTQGFAALVTIVAVAFGSVQKNRANLVLKFYREYDNDKMQFAINLNSSYFSVYISCYQVKLFRLEVSYDLTNFRINVG